MEEHTMAKEWIVGVTWTDRKLGPGVGTSKRQKAGSPHVAIYRAVRAILGDLNRKQRNDARRGLTVTCRAAAPLQEAPQAVKRMVDDLIADVGPSMAQGPYSASNRRDLRKASRKATERIGRALAVLNEG
jgi:hypothetical protein